MKLKASLKSLVMELKTSLKSLVVEVRQVRHWYDLQLLLRILLKQSLVGQVINVLNFLPSGGGDATVAGVNTQFADTQGNTG